MTTALKAFPEITHTARRDHLCAFCGMTVQQNERYVRAQAKKAFHIQCYQGLTLSNDERSMNLVSKEKHDGRS